MHEATVADQFSLRLVFLSTEGSGGLTQQIFRFRLLLLALRDILLKEVHHESRSMMNATLGTICGKNLCDAATEECCYNSNPWFGYHHAYCCNTNHKLQ